MAAGDPSRHAPPPPAWSPVTWPAWLLIGFGWLIARLPVDSVFRLGRLGGWLLYHLGRRRRHIAETNLRLCFPHLSANERLRLLRRNFTHTATGAIEIMLPWLNPARDLSPRIDMVGEAHYRAAIAGGRGVIVLATHFTTMDVISQPLARFGDFDVMYRYNKNPAWEWLQLTGRGRYFDGVVERENTREAVRRLRRGRALWYAVDQDYGRRHSVFAPLFGIPAATITAASRLATLTGSAVLFMTIGRDIDAQRWRIEFHPPLRDFPSGSLEADATRINAMLETFIRERPEQYLWAHRRFKTRPPGEPPVY